MSANIETQGNRRSIEIVKWIVVTILLIVAIVSNYLCRNILLPIRIIIVLILIVAASTTALLTTKGKAMIIFAQEARSEMRKVIWPTREETLRITLTIAAVTAVMSLIMWGLDSILVQLISFITNLRFRNV